MNKAGIRSAGDCEFHPGLPLGEQGEDRPCLATNRQATIYICRSQFDLTPSSLGIPTIGDEIRHTGYALGLGPKFVGYDSFRAKRRPNARNVGDVRISRGLSWHSRGRHVLIRAAWSWRPVSSSPFSITRQFGGRSPGIFPTLRPRIQL